MPLLVLSDFALASSSQFFLSLTDMSFMSDSVHP